MNRLIVYCRSGFESDLANELQHRAADLQVYGYPQFEKHAGYIEYVGTQPEDCETLHRQLKIDELVFARQYFVCTHMSSDLDPQDRIGQLSEGFDGLPVCGDIRVEYPDTTDGRELSRFCRKFTVPLRQSLRNLGKLTKKTDPRKPILMVFFASSSKVYMGYVSSTQASPEALGILRLKFPSEAPSRSTLKLDEAFQLFLNKEQQSQLLQPGMQAVDLGACPGGWTYQLVRRGLFVQAVDNGAMAESLMETGQVKYFAEDGFKFRPKKKNVQWLVCDMIEQPQRVAALMAEWVAEGWCHHAMFNLKLPMRQRFESVQSCLDIIYDTMQKRGKRPLYRVKHLYHNREEVTVYLTHA